MTKNSSLVVDDAAQRDGLQDDAAFRTAESVITMSGQMESDGSFLFSSFLYKKVMLRLSVVTVAKTCVLLL